MGYAMFDLLTVAMICASTVPQPECRRHTASDVMTSPAATPFQCLMQGQTMVAGGLAATLPEGAYIKIVCERRRTETAQVER
jgi:hypothetical protein